MKVPTTSDLGACRAPVPLGDAMRLILAEAQRIDEVQAWLVRKGHRDAPCPRKQRLATACRRGHEILAAILPYAEEVGETIEKARRFERPRCSPSVEEIENHAGEMTLWGVVYYLGRCAVELELNEEAAVNAGLQEKATTETRTLIAALDAARDIVETVAKYPNRISDRVKQLRRRGPRA